MGGVGLGLSPEEGGAGLGGTGGRGGKENPQVPSRGSEQAPGPVHGVPASGVLAPGVPTSVPIGYRVLTGVLSGTCRGAPSPGDPAACR